MKMYLVSDNIDTRTGMRLAGIEGVVVHEAVEVREILDQLLKEREIEVVLITEKLAKLVPDTIRDIKLNRKLPLIVEIPDRHGTVRPPDSITRYVKESIGLKL